jgi:hypothetical protein
MTHYNFDSGVEGWAGTGFAWTGADGSPTAGCLNRAGSFGTALVSIGGLSIDVSAGFHMEYWVKYAGVLNPIGGGAVYLRAYDSGGTALATVSLASFAEGVWTQGLFDFGVTTTPIATLEMAAVGSANTLTSLSFDSVYVAEFPPPHLAFSQVRFLGIDTDNENLYWTSVGNGTLLYHSAALTAPATITDQAAFGTAAYADPDTFVRGLFPAIRPATDGIVYLRGRDGNSKQVWYKDYGGTLGWQDIGPGTATWGTAKYCVGLMQFPLKWDVIAAFSDNDVYRTITGTANWVKAGDAPTNLQAATRHPTSLQESLLAGTAAGTLHYTHNLAQSFDVAGGTIVAGTINHIVMSRY